MWIFFLLCALESVIRQCLQGDQVGIAPGAKKKKKPAPPPGTLVYSSAQFGYQLLLFNGTYIYIDMMYHLFMFRTRPWVRCEALQGAGGALQSQGPKRSCSRISRCQRNELLNNFVYSNRLNTLTFCFGAFSVKKIWTRFRACWIMCFLFIVMQHLKHCWKYIISSFL